MSFINGTCLNQINNSSEINYTFLVSLSEEIAITSTITNVYWECPYYQFTLNTNITLFNQIFNKSLILNVLSEFDIYDIEIISKIDNNNYLITIIAAMAAIGIFTCLLIICCTRFNSPGIKKTSIVPIIS